MYNVEKLRWVQWKSRKGKVMAHAVDAETSELTGKTRTICGSLIPAHAEPWDGKADKDPFCMRLAEKGPSKRNKYRRKIPKPAAMLDGVRLSSGGLVVCFKGMRLFSAEHKVDKDTQYELRVSNKSIGVYQRGKRVFFKRTQGWTPGQMKGIVIDDQIGRVVD